MTMEICQQRIAILWFASAGLLFLIIMIQSILGVYDDPKDAWNWLLPNLLPTLSLMIGIFVADFNAKKLSNQKQVSIFLYRLTLAISAAYLLAILLTIFLRPFSELEALDLMKQGQLLWLAPLQGLVTASLGAFFVKARQGKK